MRGGGGGGNVTVDPLNTVKEGDFVNVRIADIDTNENFTTENGSNIECQVVSVDNSKSQKIVKLRIIDKVGQDYAFYNVYGGNPYDGIPMEYSKEFDIIYSQNLPLYPYNYPYNFCIYKKLNESLNVISKRHYTDMRMDLTTTPYNTMSAWRISYVEPITKSG